MKERLWKWGQSLALNAAEGAKRRAMLVSAKVMLHVDRSIDPARKLIRAQRDRAQAFLEDQGFRFHPNDCLPNPDWYEPPPPLFPKGTPFHVHVQVWREAWKQYRSGWQLFFDSYKPPKDEPEDSVEKVKKDAMQRAHELQKGVDDLKVALGINKQLGGASKEEIVAGLHEIRESLGISKDPKVAIKQASTFAKDRYATVKDSMQEFMAGYREVLEEHDVEVRKKREKATRPEGFQGGGEEEEDGEGAAKDAGREKVPQMFEWGLPVVGRGKMDVGVVGNLRLAARRRRRL